MLDENVVKALIVVRRRTEDGVLEEREGDHIRSPELAEEIIAAVQQILEEGDGAAHPRGQLGDARRVRFRLLFLGGDQVRRSLPDVVEPVDEHAHFGAARRLAGEERRVGDALLEPVDDDRRIADDLVSVDQHRDERLTAQSLNRRAVVRVDVDPLDLDRLVPGGERYPLDVGREGNAVDANQIQRFRLKNQIWPTVVATITPHENA